MARSADPVVSITVPAIREQNCQEGNSSWSQPRHLYSSIEFLQFFIFNNYFPNKFVG